MAIPGEVALKTDESPPDQAPLVIDKSDTQALRPDEKRRGEETSVRGGSKSETQWEGKIQFSEDQISLFPSPVAEVLSFLLATLFFGGAGVLLTLYYSLQPHPIACAVGGWIAVGGFVLSLCAYLYLLWQREKLFRRVRYRYFLPLGS